MLQRTENKKTFHQELKLLQLRNIMPAIFGEMDNATFNSILPLFEWKELPGNQYLFHQGDIGNSLYILVSGRVRVVIRRPDASEEIVGEMTRGETVGEMALFTGEPRTAGVVAVRDSVLVRISRQAFEEIICRYPATVMNITRQIIGRLKERNFGERNLNRVVNIALVPLGKRVDLNEFTKLLTAKMTRYGDILHLSIESVNRLLQKDDIAHSMPDSDTYHRLSALLDEQEAKHDYLIYQAENGLSEWTKRCLRQADKILLVGHATDDPNPKEVEDALLNGFHKLTTAGQVLVLLHQDKKDEITGTPAWITRREVRSHHHLVQGSEKDMERLARSLTGNAIGLVLSGGGAKGFAHIGVYKALEEYDIPIDMVGGTSIGAFVGGPIAMGWSAEKMHEAARKVVLSDLTPLSDYNFIPIVSLLKGRKFDQSLKRFIGNNTIEDLQLNFFCISSNLSKSEAVIHQNGYLRPAIRASLAIPGVLPPVILGKNLHIDGGIFNNLPIDVMEEMGVGHIAAVDLNVEPAQEIDLDCIPSTWQIIKSKLRGKKSYNVPSLMSIIIKSTTLNSDRKTHILRSRAGLYFNPDLSNFGLMEWKALDQIVEAGYRHAIEVLEKWEGF